MNQVRWCTLLSVSLLCCVLVGISGCSRSGVSQIIESDASLEMSDLELQQYNQAAFGGSTR